MWNNPETTGLLFSLATCAPPRSDWLRVILFGLLIWFHLGVFTFWLFEDEDVPLMVLFVVDVMHQWRLAALFLISGMGTAFAFRRRDAITFVKERLVRLGIPLVFATYVLLGGLFTPIETLWLLLVPFPGSDTMPYAHLWFLRNLLLYSLALLPLFAYVRNRPESGPVRAARWTVDAWRGLALIVVPSTLLTASAVLTKPWHYGEVGMWWEFPHYFLFTMFGYLAIQAGAAWFERIESCGGGCWPPPYRSASCGFQSNMTGQLERWKEVG